MSYDIRISVKVQGCDRYAEIATPEYDNPTFNLAEIFRACMDWDFKTSKENEKGEYQVCYYPCSFAIEKIERGIKELRTNRKAYDQYSGSTSCARRALESLSDCIYEQAEEIPIECLYMSWV